MKRRKSAWNMKWPKLQCLRVTTDRLIGRDRTRESFWQHKLDTFTPRGLNVKEVDT